MNSKRLLAIASLIKTEDSVVDIGCDHAYLDIYLVKNKLCKKVIASDVSEGAILQAKTNIEKYGLTKKIKVILSNGLENINIEDINTIVLSGMGTKTISDILDIPKISSIKKIIIQSNNNLEELRTFMNKRNFRIINEIIICENNKYYTIIEYQSGCEKLSNIVKKLGIFNINNIGYYNHLYNKNKIILKKIPWYNINKIFSILLLQMYINVYKKLTKNS